LKVIRHRDPKSIPDEPYLTFGSYGDGDGEFNYPYALCINSKGEIIVADEHNDRIQIFNEKGQFITKFGTYGHQHGQFSFPTGLTVDKNDNIYICDCYNYRVEIFNSDGSKHLRTLGTGMKGSSDGEFDWPHGVCIDDDTGHIYVTDYWNHRFQIFDEQGQFIGKFGKEGRRGKGELNGPTGIVINSKKEIIVGESNNRRLQVFDLQGHHLRFIGVNDNLPTIHQLCLDHQDNIYVGNWSVDDKNDGKIFVFDGETGSLIHTFGLGSLKRPIGVAFHPISQRIFVANYNLHNVMAI
jgi:DNA-binding beta-propeller fold protein YncE